MASLDLSCIYCNNPLGDSTFFQIYEQFRKFYHLIVKHDMQDRFLQQNASFKSSRLLVCKKCHTKIGKEKKIGPKGESILCLFKNAICFIKTTGGDFKKCQNFEEIKWNQLNDEYPQLEQINKKNFYKTEINSKDAKIQKIDNLTQKMSNLWQKYHYSCKFTLQAYLCDIKNDKIEDFFKKLERIDGFKHTEQCTHNTYLSNEFENCKIYNCYFEKHYNDEINDAEQVFAFETIENLLSNEIKNQALVLLKKQQEKQQQLNDNLHLMCHSIEFGNLETPFEFIKSNNVQLFENSAKFSIMFDSRTIIILVIFHNILHKFEIEFSILESFICINEAQVFLDVYIPCKRPSSVYIQTLQDRNNISFHLGFSLQNVNEEAIDWEKSSFKNHDWTLKLQFNVTDKSNLVKALENIVFNRILFCNVNTNSNVNYTINDLRSDFQSNDFETKYYLECLISQYYSILNGKLTKQFANLIKLSTPKEIRYIIKNLCSKLRSKRFLSLEKLVKSIIEQMYKYGELEFEKMNDLKNYKVLNTKHAIITPSRVIYYMPEPNVSNRVLRQFNHENFLCVRMRGENLQKLNMSQNFSDMKEIYENMFRLLCNGIDFYERRFMFVAMSASQMREHGCWMYAASDRYTTVSAIREWMGDFKSIRCIGKYTARLGQSLSCSIETIQTDDFKVVEDIKTRNNEYIFTDGIGQISKVKADEICKKYFNSRYISVFQIRFAGFKGVVSINPFLDDNSLLVFRPSMQKFESKNNRLDVLNKAEFIPCHLNRQVILILSVLGINDSIFANFQDLMLQQLNRILIDNYIASNYLLKFFKNHYSFGMGSMFTNISFDFTHEPFFRDLLKLIYNSQLSDLIKKSRIFVEKGRILMGVIDEYGVLEEDQVFIQCSTETMLTKTFEYYKEIRKSSRKDFFIVKAKVAVAKNPCMHPGDIRVLDAVDVPELGHLTNCIVFPRKGKRPITNMCSGSDLDGGKLHLIFFSQMTQNFKK
jgi:hypothetical protein